MEKVENFYKLAFLLILVFAAGITGLNPFIVVAFIATIAFFFYDTWGVGNWKVDDMVNILLIALAIIVFTLSGGFSPSDGADTISPTPITAAGGNS